MALSCRRRSFRNQRMTRRPGGVGPAPLDAMTAQTRVAAGQRLAGDSTCMVEGRRGTMGVRSGGLGGHGDCDRQMGEPAHLDSTCGASQHQSAARCVDRNGARGLSFGQLCGSRVRLNGHPHRPLQQISCCSTSPVHHKPAELARPACRLSQCLSNRSTYFAVERPESGP
jgi:hypothetical protein